MASTLACQLTTGILCASYWRGAWYILDYKLFPSDRFQSGVASLALGGMVLGGTQYVLSPAYNGTKSIVKAASTVVPLSSNFSLRRGYIQTNRFVMLYGIAMSCILLWRGTWLMWDEGAAWLAGALAPRLLDGDQEKEEEQKDARHHSMIGEFADLHHHHHSSAMIATSAVQPIQMIQQDKDAKEAFDDQMLYYSGIVCHVAATAGLLFMGRYTSVMAPPANICMLKDLFLHGKGKAFRNAARLFAAPR